MKKFFTIFLLIPQLAFSEQCTPPFISIPAKGNVPETWLRNGIDEEIEYADYVFTATVEDVKCLESSKQETESLNKKFNRKQQKYYTHNVTFSLHKVWKWSNKKEVDKNVSLNFWLDTSSPLCNQTFKVADDYKYYNEDFDLQKTQSYIIFAKENAEGNLRISYNHSKYCSASRNIEDLEYDTKEIGKPIKEFN